jgi:CheY-like chemotaxis protein
MKKKILIVDDDLDMLNLYQAVFRGNFEAILATNGKEAVDLAVAEVPDLILMDIMMPVMDGLQATHLIRMHPKTSSIPIIAVTALGGQKDKEKCLQSGCDDYLSKPFTQFTRLQLYSHIEKLLKQDGVQPSGLTPMKKKILIAEDNLAVNKALQLLLEPRYETIPAMNGKQAVDIAATQLPGLILMDMIMPVMNGYQATRQIRQNPKTHTIPILAVTALDGHIFEEKCFQSGCDDYIAKPFLAEDLCSRIEKLLKQDSA